VSSASAAGSVGFASRNKYLLKRLHTLSGVVPLGGFLAEHLWTNMHAIEGPGAFNADVNYLEHLPGLILIEMVLIVIPLLYHMIYGIKVMMDARYNVGSLPYFRNWMYTLQRWTGAFMVVFIVYHYWQFRLRSYFGLIPLNFDSVARELHNPFIMVFYILGVLTTVFHFSNGLWSFALDWGLIVSQRAQRQFTWVTLAAFVILGGMGMVSIYAFAR
jgi:succinate dehydrogenase / fumarate reductase cytochrome b subunit